MIRHGGEAEHASAPGRPRSRRWEGPTAARSAAGAPAGSSRTRPKAADAEQDARSPAARAACRGRPSGHRAGASCSGAVPAPRARSGSAPPARAGARDGRAARSALRRGACCLASLSTLEQEHRVPEQVPPPHPMRLDRESEDPFESVVGQPSGRAGNVTGDVVEQCAHCPHDGSRRGGQRSGRPTAPASASPSRRARSAGRGR